MLIKLIAYLQGMSSFQTNYQKKRKNLKVDDGGANEDKTMTFF